MATKNAMAAEIPADLGAGTVGKVEAVPLRLPFRSADKAAASEWSDQP